MRKVKAIDSFMAGWSEAQYRGTPGTFNSSIGIDTDLSLTPSGIRTSGMLVPNVYEKFSSSVVNGNVKWLITNPKNTLIYGYSDNPTGSALELNSIATLLTSPNLKAYYRMTSGAVTTDSSGQSKTLTNNGSVATTTGKFGNAADFGTNNSTKSLSIADKLSYSGGAFSISMWAKITTEITSDGVSYVLYTVSDPVSKTVLELLYQQRSGVKNVVFRRVKNGVSYDETILAITLGTTNWHLIVGTYDGGTLKMTIDNVAATPLSASGDGTVSISNESSYIGASIMRPMGTGGTVTNSGGNTIHTFTSGGTFTFFGSGNVSALVVAGGGGGGSQLSGQGSSGGGGAGALIYNASLAVTPGSYSVVVGNGGTVNGGGNNQGNDGGLSSFNGISSTGGGGGGSGQHSAGRNGGSGGGGGYQMGAGSGTTGGNNGGASSAYGAPYNGGGGGGAGAVGGSGSSGGVGGAGLSNSISGSAVTYSRGGNGNGDHSAGAANTGNGGGGGSNGNDNGGVGGSGIVIISYPTYSYTGTPNNFANALIDDVAVFNKELSATEQLYLWADGGFFISYASALDTETLISAPSGGQANGLTYYNNYVYLASNTNIDRYGPLNGTTAYTANVWTGATLGSQTALTNTIYGFQSSYSFPNHPMVVHGDNSLYVCDYINGQGKIHRIKTKKVTVEGDTNDGSAYGALTLPFGYLPTDIQSWGTDLVILAVQTTDTVVNQGRAALFFWDAASTTFYKGPLYLPDPLGTALEVMNGQLYIWTGNAQGGVRISKYIGGDSIQEVLFQEEGTPPPPGATSVQGNRLYWGNHITYPEDALGVFAYGSKTEKLPSGLHCVARATNVGSTMPAITAMAPVQQANGSRNRLIVAYRSDGEYGIDKYSTTGTHTAVWRSDIESVGGRFNLTKIRIPLGTAVAANMEIIPKVWLDDFQTSVTLPTISTALYSGAKKIVYHKLELNACQGQDNFCLELNFGGTVALPVTTPILIEYEVDSDENVAS